MKLLLKLLLLLSGCNAVALAVTISPPVKSQVDVITLASAQTTTGLGATAIDTRNGFRSCTIQVTNTGTSSTVQVAQSCDGGAHWGDLAPLATFGSGVPDGATIPNATVAFLISQPMCAYTINVTAVSAASITAIGVCGAHVP